MKLNLLGRVTRFFLYNRPLTVLVLVAAIFGGVGAYISVPKQYNPTIVLPAFQVEVGYPGATAAEVEQFVTEELAEKIADLEGVDEIYTRSIDGGRSVVTVMFEVGQNLEDSKIKLTQKIEENLDHVVFSMQPPIIKSIDPENVPILTFGFLSSERSQNELRVAVADILNELRRVPDVSNLELYGGEKKSLQIVLDPVKLKLRNVSVEQVRRAIVASNFDRQLGYLRDQESRNLVVLAGTFRSETEAQKIVVAPGVQLRDVATVQGGHQEKTSFVQVFSRDTSQQVVGRDTVFLSVAKRKGSNAITVSEQVQKKLDKILQQSQFADFSMHVFRDDGLVAKNEISRLLRNLFTSVVIVSLVLLLFLGVRAAGVVAIAIPLTIALVFVVGKFFGQTVNRITLFALILSLGLLVDNATVVIENIHRHCARGTEKKQAIVEAVNEVGIGLFVSTLTSVIVFLPTAQITGMMGEYMGPVSFFVPVALLISLLVAFVLTPFLADVFLDTNVRCELKSKKDVFERLADWYGRWLKRYIGTKNRFRKRRFLWTIFGLFFLVLTFPVFKIVHFRMLPSADREQFFIAVDLPEGTDTPRTERVAKWVVEQTLKNAEVTSVQLFVGEPSVADFNGLFKGSNLRRAPHLANLRVNLSQPKTRSESSSDIVVQVRNCLQKNRQMAPAELRSWLSQSEVLFFEDPPGPPVRSTLELKIEGADRAVLEKMAQKISTELLPTVRGVVDKKTSVEHAAERTVVRVDHEKALAAGISAQQIASTLAVMLDPVVVDQYHDPTVNEPAMVELSVFGMQRDQVQDLAQVYVQNVQHEMIPLLSVVTIEHQRTVPTLYTDERTPTAYVTGEMAGRSVVYAVLDLISPLKKIEWPNGAQLQSWDLFGFDFETPDAQQYRIEWGGEWEMTVENFRDLGRAMLIAFFLIYIVLVAQFKSSKKSLLIMTTMPLGFLGILPGFVLLDVGWDIFLTSTSLIGFIALMGIVVNNAIIYLEYLEILRERGASLHEALVQAGKTRLRPILLTSATTVLGNLTIVSDSVWSGLAWAIVFGLSLSAVLTLGVFPLLYEQQYRDENL